MSAAVAGAVAAHKARLEERLALTELLIALADESAPVQRQLAEDGGLAGETLAQALTSLALIESSGASRRAERKGLIAALSSLPS